MILYIIIACVFVAIVVLLIISFKTQQQNLHNQRTQQFGNQRQFPQQNAFQQQQMMQSNGRVQSPQRYQSPQRFQAPQQFQSPQKTFPESKENIFRFNSQEAMSPRNFQSQQQMKLFNSPYNRLQSPNIHSPVKRFDISIQQQQEQQKQYKFFSPSASQTNITKKNSTYTEIHKRPDLKGKGINIGIFSKAKNARVISHIRQPSKEYLQSKNRMDIMIKQALERTKNISKQIEEEKQKALEKQKEIQNEKNIIKGKMQQQQQSTTNFKAIPYKSFNGKQDKNGLRQGKGLCVYKTGESYDGDWKNDMRHGYGILKSKDNKEIYNGYWEQDMFEGDGIFYNINHQKRQLSLEYQNLGQIMYFLETYIGDFNQGRFEGRGKIKFSNKEEFEGYFAQGVAHGQGEFFTKDGKIIKGKWVNNKLVNQEKQQLQLRLMGLLHISFGIVLGGAIVYNMNELHHYTIKKNIIDPVKIDIQQEKYSNAFFDIFKGIRISIKELL